MKKQWTATALVMALGLAAPVLAQDDPIPPDNDPTQRQTNPSTQPDGVNTPTPTPAPETPAPVDRTTSADREAAKQATAMAGEEYVVQKGDTLSGLAERFMGSAGNWKQIADANGIQNPNMLSVGMKLNIPQSGQGSTGDDTMKRSRTRQQDQEPMGGSTTGNEAGSGAPDSDSTLPDNR